VLIPPVCDNDVEQIVPVSVRRPKTRPGPSSRLRAAALPRRCTGEQALPQVPKVPV